MRHFSIFGGALAIASLSFMFSSCSKQLDQPADPDRQEITAKTTHECKECPGEYINLVSKGVPADFVMPTAPKSPFFFWRGEKYQKYGEVPVYCRQYFRENDFSNTEYFIISAEGGVPFVDRKTGALGVNDGYINKGEALILHFSDCMLGHLMDGFTLVFHSNLDKGVIELYHGEHQVATVPFSKATNLPYPELMKTGSQNYPVVYQSPTHQERFDKVIIRMTSGKMRWVGYQRNLNLNLPMGGYPYYEASRFHVNKP